MRIFSRISGGDTGWSFPTGSGSPISKWFSLIGPHRRRGFRFFGFCLWRDRALRPRAVSAEQRSTSYILVGECSSNAHFWNRNFSREQIHGETDVTSGSSRSGRGSSDHGAPGDGRGTEETRQSASRLRDGIFARLHQPNDDRLVAFGGAILKRFGIDYEARQYYANLFSHRGMPRDRFVSYAFLYSDLPATQILFSQRRAARYARLWRGDDPLRDLFCRSVDPHVLCTECIE